MQKMLFSLGLAITFWAATTHASENELTPAEKAAGWRLLFDGNSLDGWKCNNGNPVATPIEDGAIVPFRSGGYLVIHEQPFENFILKCDVRWEDPRCNSGIFFRIEDPANPVHTGFEVQVMGGDEVGKHQFGAIYDLVATKENRGKPRGEWNTVEIRCFGPVVEVHVNGAEVASMNTNRYREPGQCPDGSPHKYQLDGQPRAVRDFSRKGFLGFQDHGHKVWYRNIKVLELPSEPTAAEVAYAEYDPCVLDFWKAPGEGPHPLLVFIHGGGWVGGDKRQGLDRILPFLAKGISYATVNYRLTGEAALPAPVHDAARAVQFLRSKADEWEWDPDRIALTGGSAGACTSMWILLHDDLADPESPDPIARQSTRVTAAAVSGGQTSIDPPIIRAWLGENVLKHRMIWMAVGEPDMESALRNYDQHQELYREFSPFNHVTADDPPLFMSYGGNMTLPSQNAGHGIHHPVFGIQLQEKSKSVGHPCFLKIPGVSDPAPYSTAEEFLVKQLKGVEEADK